MVREQDNVLGTSDDTKIQLDGELPPGIPPRDVLSPGPPNRDSVDIMCERHIIPNTQYISFGLAIVGVFFLTLGIAQINHDCREVTYQTGTINIAWRLIILGISLLISSILILLLITDQYKNFSICNNRRIEITKVIIFILLFIAALPVLTFPTIMFVDLFNLPSCAFQFNLFMVAYIAVACLFNVATIITVGIIGGLGALCYHAE